MSAPPTPKTRLALLLVLSLACRGNREEPTNAAPPPVDLTEAVLPASPDLLFVTWDTTRADHVSAYGYGRETTPRFDNFAASGVLFERYLVPMATTLPCHTSMFTGVQPLEHGVVANTTFTGERFVPPAGLRPLAVVLADGGYLTAGFVSSSPLKRASGIALGFTAWDQPQGSSRRAKATTDAALAWLAEADPDQPIFLWVHYYDPHSPYVAVDELKDHFRDDKVLREHMAARRYGAPSARASSVKRLNAYDADILYTDQQFGRLLDAWDASGRAERSIVLVAGDHGEGLMQHGQLEHGDLWNEQLHSLAALRAPGVVPRKVPDIVQAVDLTPTAFGLGEFPGEQAFLSLATGVDVLSPTFTPRPAFSRTSLRQVHLGDTLAYALTAPRWKLIVHNDDRRELYDLLNDPHELVDVSRKSAKLVATMEAALRQARQEQHDRGEAWGAGQREKLSEEMVSELAELGYLE